MDLNQRMEVRLVRVVIGRQGFQCAQQGLEQVISSFQPSISYLYNEATILHTPPSHCGVKGPQ